MNIFVEESVPEINSGVSNTQMKGECGYVSSAYFMVICFQ